MSLLITNVSQIEVERLKVEAYAPRRIEHEASHITNELKLNELTKELKDMVPTDPKRKFVEKTVLRMNAELQLSKSASNSIVGEQERKYTEERVLYKKLLYYSYIVCESVTLKTALTEHISEYFKESDVTFHINLKVYIEQRGAETAIVKKSTERKIRSFIKVDASYAITQNGEKIPMTDKDAAMIIGYPCQTIPKKSTMPGRGSRSTFGQANK